MADDEADAREVLTQVLHPDYEVMAAADGQEAVDLARAEHPDIILLDLNMPRLDGVKFLVLDEGRLVALVSHAGLLAAGGLYAQLYLRQFRTQHAPDTAAPQPVPAKGQALLQPAATTAR